MATNEEIERVGDLLLEEGVVTQEELVRAISESGVKGTALSVALESSRHPKRQELAVFLATDFRIPRIADLRQVDFHVDAVRAVPEDLARKHELVPVARIGGILCVAKPNYFNRAAIQELRRVTGLKVKVLQADEGQVKAAVDKIYGGARGELPPPRDGKKDTVMRRVDPLITGSRSDVLAAVRIPPAEYQAEERSVHAKLYREWDDLFVNGRPSSPIKVG